MKNNPKTNSDILKVGKPKNGDKRPAIQDFGWNTLTPQKPQK